MDMSNREGSVIACTRYAGNYELVTYLLNDKFEASEYEEPIAIHSSKGNLKISLDRINCLVYYEGAYWTYSDDGTICKICAK